MRAIALLCLSVTLIAAQQQTPARDTTRTQGRTGTGAIRGRVVAADTGAPIRRATVSIYSEGEPPAGGTVLTDARGGFAVEKLPADTYRLSVRPNRYQTRYLARPLAGLAAAGAPVAVTLRDGEIVDTLQVTLVRAGVILGRVFDENGDPVTGITVTTERARGTPDTGSWMSASTDDLGRFRLFNLAPGEYYVSARGDDVYQPIPGVDPSVFVTTYGPGASSRADATRVRVEPGREASVDIRLMSGRTYRVSGLLLDSQGRPVSGGEVAIHHYDRFGGTSRGVTTDAQARFTLDPRPPGDYRLSGKLVDESGAVSEFVKVPITIADADITGFVLTTRPAVRVTGQVVFAEGAPAMVPPLRIGVTAPDRTLAPDGPPEGPRVERDLSFTIRGAFGDVILRPLGLPTGWYLKAVMRGNEDITDTPREFTANDSGRVQVILSSRMSTIDGRIVDAGTRPLDGNIVVLFGEDRQTWHSYLVGTPPRSVIGPAISS
jgi:hypothetical protein